MDVGVSVAGFALTGGLRRCSSAMLGGLHVEGRMLVALQNTPMGYVFALSFLFYISWLSLLICLYMSRERQSLPDRGDTLGF